MRNPLMAKFNQGQPMLNGGSAIQPGQVSPELFVNTLRSQGPDFLQKMQQLARQRGISENDIKQGMAMLQGFLR